MHDIRFLAGGAFAALALSFAACSPAAAPITVDHPASASAPRGRLAPPPPALAPGIAGDVLTPPPPVGAVHHDQHDMPDAHDMHDMKMPGNDGDKAKP